MHVVGERWGQVAGWAVLFLPLLLWFAAGWICALAVLGDLTCASFTGIVLGAFLLGGSITLGPKEK